MSEQLDRNRVPGYPGLSYKGGRPSMLKDPNLLKAFAEFVAQGLSRKAIIAEMEDAGFAGPKDVDTVSAWKRDPRVKSIVSKLIEDRAIQVSRKIDAIIEGRLSQAEHLSMKDLIMIRKEYGGSTLGRKEIADDSVTVGALKELENNPDLADELERLLTESAEA